MEFSLSPVQTSLHDSVRRFCREQYDLRRRTALVSCPDGFSRSHWSMFAELGWLGIALQPDVHGTEGSAIEFSIILEEFGRWLVVEPYWSCVVLAGQLVNHCANPQQRSELLNPLVDGNLMIAFAHSEGYGDNSIERVETRATCCTDGTFVINGRKSTVIGGPSANKFIVSARTGGATDDRDGISLFVIDRDAEGLLQRDYRMLDGGRACDLEMNDLRVKGDNLLGQRDSGIAAIEFATDQAVVGLCAEAVGIMDGALWMTRDYLRTRRQFGAPLATLQALQHRMADMFAEAELSRSMLFRTLGLLGGGESTARRAGVLAAHVRICQGGMFVCKNAIQLHGAMGVLDEHMIGQYFKRLVVLSGLFGGIDQELERFASLPDRS